MNYLDNLNDKQKEAVMHKDGPALVLAGAGSGKTKVLTTRIVNLVNEGIDSYHILAITFTNKAAKEMKERIYKMLPSNDSFIGTFHSFGMRLLRENFELIGLKKNWTILDGEDVLSIIKKILKAKNYDPKEYSPAFIRSKISFIKNEMLSQKDIDKFFNTHYEKIALEVYERYQEVICQNNSVDFDDLLLLPVALLKENMDVLRHYQEKYKYILIDEYQDTNEVQYQLTKLLAKKYKNIFCVGDGDQSIYSFRGANYHNILNFERDYEDAKVILLEENYRSTTNILNVANSIIKNNKSRKEKNLWSKKNDDFKVRYLRSYDEKNEVTLVINEIQNMLVQGFKYEDFACLYRTNAQSRVIEEMLLKANIPYKVVGSYYFYNRKEIKDLLSYLRLIYNPNDELSLKRIINVPKRGIGDKRIEKLEDLACENKTSLFEALETAKELSFKEFIIQMREELENISLTELIDAVLDRSGIIAELKNEKTLESDIRIENLMEFKSITHSFEERTGSVNLGDFLEEISLIADISEHKSDADAITLMTIHSAKGLEFKVVFLMGLEEGIFPHSNAFLEKEGIEEERRLCYVGVTRAKERLFLTNAKTRLLYGRQTINTPSRFIDEIDKQFLEMPKNIKEKIQKEDLYEKEGQEYNSGDHVVHSIYGRGIIIETNKEFISVAFSKNYGIKKLLKNHKSIRKVN